MYYEFDVLVRASFPDLLMSDGIIYMDYNPAYFGNSTVSNGRLFVDLSLIHI